MFREICRLTTAATRTYGVLEGTDNRDTDGVVESEASYLMAITERVIFTDVFYYIFNKNQIQSLIC